MIVLSINIDSGGINMKIRSVVCLIFANLSLAGALATSVLKADYPVLQYAVLGCFALFALFLILFAVGLAKRSAERKERQNTQDREEEIFIREMRIKSENLEKSNEQLSKNLSEKTDEIYVLHQSLKKSDSKIKNLEESLELMEKESVRVENERQKDTLLAFLPGDGTSTRLEKIDIVSVCKEVIRDLARFASQAGIRIVVTSDEDQVWLLANHDRMAIMFRNVIDNSIKYMKRSGVLNIIIGTHDSEVFIVLRDNGEGIDSSLTEKIFELNFQGPNRVSGNGLGLTQAKAIVEYYNGNIYAKSDSGEGMAIYIKLPAI